MSIYIHLYIYQNKYIPIDIYQSIYIYTNMYLWYLYTHLLDFIGIHAFIEVCIMQCNIDGMSCN